MSSPQLVATPLWAALLAILYIVLTVQVIRGRYRTRTVLGNGGDQALERAIRAHANFAEYVPLTLVLLLLLELQGAWPWFVNLMGLLLLVGRASHAFGISSTAEVLVRRQFGTVATVTALSAAALGNLAMLAH